MKKYKVVGLFLLFLLVGLVLADPVPEEEGGDDMRCGDALGGANSKCEQDACGDIVIDGKDYSLKFTVTTTFHKCEKGNGKCEMKDNGVKCKADIHEGKGCTGQPKVFGAETKVQSCK